MVIESVFALALSVPLDPSLKCGSTQNLPGYPEKSAVMLIDGEIRGSNVDFSIDSIDATDIARLEIKCWNPVTDELPAARGVQLIVISTYSGQARAESQTLDAARLVHAFVDEHGELPTALEEIDPDLAGYSIEEAELGWHLRSADIDGLACLTSRLGSLNDEVGCSFAYSTVKQRLRRAWDAESGVFRQ